MQIIGIFEKLIKKKLSISYENKRRGDIPYMVADNSKLKNNLKFRNKYNIADIIKSSLKWELDINKDNGK